jgi:hypothetical protein
MNPARSHFDDSVALQPQSVQQTPQTDKTISVKCTCLACEPLEEQVKTLKNWLAKYELERVDWAEYCIQADLRADNFEKNNVELQNTVTALSRANKK